MRTCMYCYLADVASTLLGGCAEMFTFCIAKSGVSFRVVDYWSTQTKPYDM